MDLEKQQKLLRRSLSNLNSLLSQASNSGQAKDFVTFSTAPEEFKTFVKGHITAPEIVGFVGEIRKVRAHASDPSLLRIMLMPAARLFTNEGQRVSNQTLSDVSEVRGKLGSLEILVGMMTDD